MDRLPDGVVVIDAERRITFMNRAAERLSGWGRDAARGRFYGDVLVLRDAAGFLLHERDDPFDRTLATVGRSTEREYLLRRADGEERWVALRATFERDARGRIATAYVAIRDAGRRRRLDRARSDLISTVSHEIRSPLTSVKGFTSTLLRKWERFSDEQKRHMLTTINADADRVTRLLGDLLDVARLEAGRFALRRQEVDLASLVSEVAGRLSHAVEEHEVSAVMPADLPAVFADPARVEQVLVNLIENALKYATPGPVSVTGTRVGSGVVVRVSDAGPGIDAHHLPHIFSKFYRRGERRGGAGLGLYIAKGIVEAHGGRILVERSGAEGTVFSFSLPVAEEDS